MAFTERYVSVAGGGAHDGTSEADAWTLAEAIAAAGAGHRVNVKAGTYANTTSTLTFAAGGGAGTNIAPKWWRGYNTTIGDIEGDNSLTKPAITFTTGGITVSSPFQFFTHLSVSGARAAAQFNLNSDGCKIDRCRIENTSSGASTHRALDFTSSAFRSTLTRSWLKANAVADIALLASPTVVYGTHFEGGRDGASCSSGIELLGCLFRNQARDAMTFISGSSVQQVVLFNTVYNAGRDGVRFSFNPSPGLIAGNLFSVIAGWGINNTAGANDSRMTLISNDFHSCTSGTHTGITESADLSWKEKAESGSPFTAAGSADFSLTSSAVAKAGALLEFENLTLSSYWDSGAAQRQEPASSGGGIIGVIGE